MSQRLTLQQVLQQVRLQHPSHHRSLRAQAAAWYKQGYYMREDGYWYSWDGNKEYRKYYTGS